MVCSFSPIFAERRPFIFLPSGILPTNRPGWMRSLCERVASQRESIYLLVCSVLGFKARILQGILTLLKLIRRRLAEWAPLRA
jgi:hypothetical protein